MADVQGIYAAAITPRGKQSEIDFGACFELVDLLAKGGASGIALFTGAGEYAALAPEERSRLVYLAVKRSRLPVLVGVGSATLDDSVSLAREARDAGAAALLLPPPYFFRYEQDDVYEFYQQFAAHVGAGAVTFLSNDPAHTTGVEVDTVRALIASGHFAGIEEASGDAQTFTCMKTASPCVLVGNDPFLPDALRAGADGAVSAVAGAVPELVVGLDRAIRGGKEAEAQVLESNLRDFLAWCREFPPTVALRVTAGIRGIKTGAHSVPLSASKQKRMEEFREWLKGWLPGVIIHR